MFGLKMFRCKTKKGRYIILFPFSVRDGCQENSGIRCIVDFNTRWAVNRIGNKEETLTKWYQRVGFAVLPVQLQWPSRYPVRSTMY